MPGMQIEFTDETLVYTEQGVQRLVDILHRPVRPTLWAIKWCYKGHPNGISFHKSHKLAKEFSDLQIDSEPDGPARLVDVSSHIFNCVQENGYCWTDLESFNQAIEYKGRTWSH